MSFKLNMKKKSGTTIELTFDEMEQSSHGLILIGYDRDNNKYKFIWPTLNAELNLPPTQ